MRKLKTLGSALLVTLVAITCVDYVASAATGGDFILGKLNSANDQSTLKRTTGGPVLNLVTDSSSNAPLKTNGKGKVTNLNADRLDGKHANAFAPASIAANTPVAVGFINVNGTIASSRGVTSATFDDPSNDYVITLTGIDYVFNAYATTVTLAGGCAFAGSTVQTGSVGGNLIVHVDTADGTDDCAFAFSVIALP